MCSNVWSHIKNTNAFSCALLSRVVYSSQFYCLSSSYFSAHSIFTGKAGAKDFAVYSYLLEMHISSQFGLIISSLRDSAPPMAVVEKHRLYNKKNYSTGLGVVFLEYMPRRTKYLRPLE